MADRTVVAKLVLDIAGYTPAAVEASKSTSALAIAQKETAAAAKEAGIAQRDAGIAAKDASAEAAAAAKALSVAQKEATAAAKEAAATEAVAAKASTDAEREEATAVAATAAERSAAAKEAVAAAEQTAAATAKSAAAAKDSAAAAAKQAIAQRDVAAAAKEAAVAETASAKESEAAAAKRTEAYNSSGKAMTTMAVGGAAAIGLMVKSAGDFESATQHLVTDAGESQANLAMVQAGILKTAAATGTGTAQLVDAMYHIESAGFHGAAGLDVLTTAAEGAKVGNADLGTVAKTLTGTLNSYSASGYTSTQMMNMLIAAVGAGDMKMNDLAGSLGNVAPLAAAAGIKFSEVGGAIATMTSQNMSADQSTQDLANTIRALSNPNQVAIQQMQQLGLDSNDVSMNLGKRGLTGTLELLTTAVANHTQNGQVFIDTLKSSKNAAADMDVMLKQLPPSIQDISKKLMDGTITTAQYNQGISGLDASQLHLAKQFEGLAKTSGSFNDLLKSGKPEAETFNAAISNLTGGATGLNTTLMLSGGRMATFKDDTAKIQDAADKSGASVDNWDKIQGTFNQKIDVAKASLGAMGIAIGTTLLPAIASMAGWITDIVTPIAAWVDKHQTLTTMILGSAAALAALVLAIKLAMKTADLFKSAFDGVTAAVNFFTKSSETAAVKAEALGVANATAAKETEAAAVSTGGWASKLGGAIPIIGGVIAGAAALGTWLNHVADSSDKAGASVDQLTTMLMKGSGSTEQFGFSAAQAQQAATALGASSHTAIEPMAAIGVAMAKTGQLMGHGADLVKNYDAALATMATSGQGDRAASLMAQIASATDDQGRALINTQKDFPQYWAALDKNAATQSLAKNAADGSTAALGGNTTGLDANAVAAKASADATAAMGQATGASAATTDKATQASKDQANTLYAATAASRALADAQTAATTVTDASAKAAAEASKAAGGDAAAQAAAAEAAKEAAAEHDIGTEALKGWAKAAGDTSHSADVLDSSVTAEVGAMKDAKAKTDSLRDALDALNGVHIAASKAAIDVQSKTADLTKALHDNGTTLDITTDKGRTNMSTVLDLASAINAHAQAVVDETGSVDAGNKSLDASRIEFDKVLTAAGVSKDKIKEFNDTLLATPKMATIPINVDTSAASKAMRDFRDAAGHVLYIQLAAGTKATFAHGGLVGGHGTDTSDNVPIMASPGEFVVTAAAARAVGVGTLNRINAMGGSGTIVKPQIIASVGGTTAQPSAALGGPPLHIEHYHEAAGGGATQTAHELEWLLRARGAAS